MRQPYRPRWPLLLTLIAGVAAVLALVYATATIDTSTEAVPERGGAYTEGVAGTPQRINPLLITNQAEGDLAALIFSGLVRLGPRGDIQPDLAERWTISPDGREYTFNLRRNLFWHDGVPLEARDVLFTVELIQDEDYEGDQRLAEVFSAVTVEAPDDSTVVMTLEEPFAPFLSYATFGILPQHLLSGRSVTAIMDAPFNQSPVGSGPFELRRLEADRAVLQSFDLYHLGAPLLDEFIVRFYRDDATLLNALLNGAVDGALLQSPLTPDDIALIDDDATWVRRGLHSTRFSLVYLNQSLEAFRDENVRRALQVGLSREEIIQSVFAGQAIPVDAPIVPDIWAYDASPEAYAFDADRATSLLEEAGWRLQPGGVREQDGEPLEFTLSTVDEPTQVRLAEAIARQWGRLGARVTVQAVSADEFTERVLSERDYEAALSTIQPPGADPDPYPFWHSSQAFGDGRNIAGFAHERADELLESARQSPSPESRARDYAEFQRIFAEELPAILLFTPAQQYIVRSDVQGLSPGLLFTPSSRFFDVHRWFVESARPTPE